MSMNDLQPYGGNQFNTGIALVDGAFNKVCQLIHYGKYLDAAKEVQIARAQFTHEENMMILRILQQCAERAEDDYTILEINHTIRMIMS